MRKFEIKKNFETHSESHFVRTRKEANKIFEEAKEQFKEDKTMKEISFNLVTLIDEEIKREPLERIERK